MKRPAILYSLFLVLSAAVASGETPQPAASPAVTPTPETVTQSEGSLPASLEGAWLLVLQTQTARGPLTNWNIYRIGKKQDAWRVQRYERPQGTPLDDQLAAASKDQKE